MIVVVGRNRSGLCSDSLLVRRTGDRIPVVARFSAPVQNGSGTYPSSCAVGTGSLPGVKVYLCFPCGPSWRFLGRSLPLPSTGNILSVSGRENLYLINGTTIKVNYVCCVTISCLQSAPCLSPRGQIETCGLFLYTYTLTVAVFGVGFIN